MKFEQSGYINNPPSVRAIGLSGEVIDTQASYSIIKLNRMRQIVPLKKLIYPLVYLINENKLPLTMDNSPKNKAPLSCAKQA